MYLTEESGKKNPSVVEQTNIKTATQCTCVCVCVGVFVRCYKNFICTSPNQKPKPKKLI